MDDEFAWLSATLASDAAEGQGVLPEWIQALSVESRVVGPAFVVLTSQNDNHAVVEAIALPPPPRSVLVVAGQSTSRTATIGGLRALELQNLGVAGLVTDGPVRDAQEIRELGLPVWSRGTTPIAPARRGTGKVGGTVLIGGALVQDGDLIIADADGVVVWPQAEVELLSARARTRLASDNERLAALQQDANPRPRSDETTPH